MFEQEKKFFEELEMMRENHIGENEEVDLLFAMLRKSIEILESESLDHLQGNYAEALRELSEAIDSEL